MTIQARRFGDTFEVTLTNRLTSADHSAFRELLSRIKDSGSALCVLELSNLDWIDSAGLGMLIFAKEAASKVGAELILRSPKGHVKELLALGHLDKILTVEF
jgi:HptB-dependent secretion and biofilm anti anti-sigma factor